MSDNAKIERFSVKTAKPGSHAESGFGFAWFFFGGALLPLEESYPPCPCAASEEKADTGAFLLKR